MLDNVKKRKQTWLLNAFLSLPLRFSSKLRDKNTWVFGCWNGTRYDDSPRYLYEYVLVNYPQIKAIWITRSEEIEKELRSVGKPVFLVGTKAAKKAMLNAGVAFYSNGLDDFGYVCYICGAMINNLNHGALPIKDLNYFEFDKVSKFIALLKKIRNKIFNWMYFDYLVVTSEKSKRMYMRAFAEFDDKKFICSGLPRYDVLLNCDYINKTTPYFLKPNKKYVLYLPTFRTYPNSVVSEFINAISTATQSGDMKLKDTIFIIKPHPAEKFYSKNSVFHSLIIVDINDSISTQELLSVADVLITDYSSCCIDFCITEKPIILYAPDHSRYKATTGISEDFAELYSSSEVIKTSSELLSRVKDILSNNTTDKLSPSLNKQYNEYYNDIHGNVNCCSKLVFDVISQKLCTRYSN